MGRQNRSLFEAELVEPGDVDPPDIEPPEEVARSFAGPRLGKLVCSGFKRETRLDGSGELRASSFSLSAKRFCSVASRSLSCVT